MKFLTTIYNYASARTQNLGLQANDEQAYALMQVTAVLQWITRGDFNLFNHKSWVTNDGWVKYNNCISSDLIVGLARKDFYNCGPKF